MTGERQGADRSGHADPDGVKAAELTCPSCGEIVYPNEIFCEECGHRIAEAPAGPPEPARPPEPAGPSGPGGAVAAVPPAGEPARDGAAARACVGCAGAAIDADGYCETCGLRQPAERDHVEVELPAPGGNGAGPVIAAGASDRGRRYSRNEDAFAVAAHSSGVAAVVCDGVGSSQRPEDASQAAAETGAAELVALLDSGAAPEDATREAALRAAEAVAALSTSPGDAPSCTYVSAVTRGPVITVGWIGDSRVYWLSADGAVDPGEDGRPGDSAAEGPSADEPGPEAAEVGTGDMAELGPSRRLTEDDSWAAFMVAQGALSEAEADAHPNAHVITAWLGADAEQVRPHVATFRPAGPGTLLVCSDGLWNYFPSARDLVELLSAGPDDPAPDTTVPDIPVSGPAASAGASPDDAESPDHAASPGDPASGSGAADAGDRPPSGEHAAAVHGPAADTGAEPAQGAEGTATVPVPRPGHDPAADPLAVARMLVRRALDAGGRDNITVVVIPHPSPAAPHERTHESIPQSTEQPR